MGGYGQHKQRIGDNQTDVDGQAAFRFVRIAATHGPSEHERRIGDNRTNVDGEVAVVDETFYASRWKLQCGTIHISKWSVTNGVQQSSTVKKSVDGTWELAAGGRYRVFGFPAAGPSTILSPRSSTVDETGSSTQFSVEWPGVPLDSRVVSSYSEVRNMRGRSELSKLNIIDFQHQLVVQLPDQYNGNMVFELPPKESKDLLKKGAMLEGMDRTYECWMWTKLR
ncbi:hypothetical protein R1sor_000188 [Riccia sorocarpa]|uniref:Uncharacterized protein n=1 Tax=Riccia sorocarpa TaxID=122646 RepID=A0ABD3GWK3_9MARC